MGAGGCQDVDDVGVLCMANAMADAGEIEILAIALNTMADAAAVTIGVLQRHYGRETVPVGVYKEGITRACAGDACTSDDDDSDNVHMVHEHLTQMDDYLTVLANRWSSPITGTAELPSAVD
eukprot:4924558-Prymnesium_polylepis.1